MSELELVKDVGVTLIGTNASDDMVAMAAWVSHDADSEARLEDKERVKSLINFLYSNRHMSPFEHGQFIFKVDVPLFVAREFHRHRTMSYNEVSGRYTQMKPRFWVGDVARVQKGRPGQYYFEAADDDTTAIYLQSKRKAVKKAWKEYTRRLEAGMAKEQAREDLPLSLMTQFYATVNPRNLMHFLSLRTDKHALKEIRMVAQKMEEIFAQTMPLTYRAYRAEQERQANPAITDQKLLITIANLQGELKDKNKLIEALRTDLLELNHEVHELMRENDALKKKHEDEFRSRVQSGPHTTTPYTLNIVSKVLENPEEIASKIVDAMERRYKNSRRIR